jgi:dihydrofolate reductase
MIISLIVAMDERGGIGIKNRVPWHLPSDLKRFKALTMGHHLILGRKTYESIGRALPGRMMIIVTRSKNYQALGCLTVSSLEDALKLAEERGEIEVFIAGGGTIYTQSLALADRIYLTRVHAEVEAEVFFPNWDMRKWQSIYQDVQAQTENESPAYSYYILERAL